MRMARVALVALALLLPLSAVANCVDINTTSVQELWQIIHIVVVRAPQIVELRERRRFSSVDQLTAVKEIAAGRIRDNKAHGLACVR